MKPITIPGLSCYENCVINIAHLLGVDYPLSFSALWSETDFAYDQRFDFYSTRRMPERLEALGMKIDKTVCHTPEQTELLLGYVESGAFVIIGLDAFYLPWSPIYQMARSAHYFFAWMDDADLLRCCDPSYGEAQVWFPRSEIVSHAFEVCRITRVAQRPFRADARREAERVVQASPRMRAEILGKMEDARQLLSLGKYVDALVGNRCLYRHYLDTSPLFPHTHLFHDDLLMEWRSVKNGLLKASLLSKKEKTISRTKEIFCGVMDRELAIARRQMNA